MEQIIRTMLGKEVDINCGGTANFRGEPVEINNGIVKLKLEEGGEVFIVVDKITAIGELQNEHHRPGFIV